MSGHGTKWGQWFAILLGSTAVVAAAWISFIVVMDPLGVWDSEPICSVSNWKHDQWNNDRLFKAYQLQNRDPQVVIFGTSRTNMGYPAFWPGKKPGEVYNLGQSGIHIPELEMLVDHVLATKSPKTLVFALEPLSFSSHEIAPKPGFSKTRLEMIEMSRITHLANKLRETVLNWDVLGYVRHSMRTSAILPRSVFFDDWGWASYKGMQRNVNKEGYTLNTWVYLTVIYRKLTVAPQSVAGFRRIIEKVTQRGVRPVVLLNPLSLDYLLALEANGKFGLLETLKRSLVKITPLWDFAYVNSVTSVRMNYLDGAHHNGHVGRMVLSKVAGAPQGVPADFGVLLTPENLDPNLSVQRTVFARRKQMDSAMLSAMNAGLRHGQKRLWVDQISKIIRFPFEREAASQ